MVKHNYWRKECHEYQQSLHNIQPRKTKCSEKQVNKVKVKQRREENNKQGIEKKWKTMRRNKKKKIDKNVKD